MSMYDDANDLPKGMTEQQAASPDLGVSGYATVNFKNGESETVGFGAFTDDGIDGVDAHGDKYDLVVLNGSVGDVCLRLDVDSMGDPKVTTLESPNGAEKEVESIDVVHWETPSQHDDDDDWEDEEDDWEDEDEDDDGDR